MTYMTYIRKKMMYMERLTSKVTRKDAVQSYEDVKDELDLIILEQKGNGYTRQEVIDMILCDAKGRRTDKTMEHAYGLIYPMLFCMLTVMFEWIRYIWDITGNAEAGMFGFEAMYIMLMALGFSVLGLLAVAVLQHKRREKRDIVICILENERKRKKIQKKQKHTKKQ